MKRFYLSACLLALFTSLDAQHVATFDDFDLQPDSYWNGSDGSGGFESDGFWFPNDYNSEWGSWSGFSVSNMKDSVTAGYGNQYSAVTTSGVDSSANYAVAYVSGELIMQFENPTEISGFFITNATYSYLSMRDGDDYAKKFGGEDGTDEDYFKLIVSGVDIYGNETSSVEFFLADFRAEDPDSDYILNTWEWVDLSSLGVLTGLNFSLESTDTGDWDMNTPAYFCMDNFNGIPTDSLTLLAEESYYNGSDTELKVYPNPVKNSFFVELPPSAEELFLADQSGRIIFQKDVHSASRVSIFALNNRSPGIYFLKVKSSGGISTSIVIKN
jgi:hypothetical protein